MAPGREQSREWRAVSKSCLLQKSVIPKGKYFPVAPFPCHQFVDIYPVHFRQAFLLNQIYHSCDLSTFNPLFHYLRKNIYTLVKGFIKIYKILMISHSQQNYQFSSVIINKMLQQINTMNHPQTRENPQSQALSQSQIDTKKKKKKFKIKKYVKSPNKHHPFTTNNPLYEALNDQDIINTNQLNFGPWIMQEPKSKEQFFPSLDKNQSTITLKNQQNLSKYTSSLENKQMSKSQQLLSKFNYLTIPTKLEKVSSRNSAYFKVPVWNAFIEERTISVSTNNAHHSLKKEMMKERQTSVNLEIGKRKPNINLVSIGSTEDSNSQRKIKFNALNREVNNFKSETIGSFHGHSSTKLDLLNKIKANAVVYNYCCENESKFSQTFQNIREKEERTGERRQERAGERREERTGERKVDNNLKRRKHEIFQKRLNEMQLKLVVPQEKSKLIFLPHSQRISKPTVSKYIFMDLLQMRAKAK